MVSDSVLKAIARLEADADFRVFMDEVKRRRDAARDELELTTDAWMTGRAQGAARFGTDLIELTQSARSAVARRQQQ